MKILKVGLIGLGRFGELQVKVLNQLENVKIESLSSRSKERVVSIGKKYGVKKQYTDYKKLIEDEEVEAVFIVSDAEMHISQALYAIANRKDVFLEKPPAITYEDILKIIKSAKEAGIFLMVGYILRFDIAHLTLKKYIDDGKLGNIITMCFKRNSSRHWIDKESNKYMHPVNEAMTHDIDLALWYTNSEVKEVYAKQVFADKNKNYPDACIALMSFENNAIASFGANWLIPKGAPINFLGDNGTLDASLEIIGTNMIAKINSMDNGFAVWDDNRFFNPETRLWPEVNMKIEGALKNEISHFIECVLNNKESSICSNQDVLYGAKVAEAVIKSLREKREISLAE